MMLPRIGSHSAGMCVLILLFCAGLPASATAAGKAKQADRLYQEGKYEEALEQYEKALSAKPDDPVIRYNQGAAFYRNDNFTEAFDAFLVAFGAETGQLEGNAAYNAGNSKFRMGEGQEKGDALVPAIAHYKEALEYYKKAIEVSPEDEDAKYNYEFTLKKIRELEKKRERRAETGARTREGSETRGAKERSTARTTAEATRTAAGATTKTTRTAKRARRAAERGAKKAGTGGEREAAASRIAR